MTQKNIIHFSKIFIKFPSRINHWVDISETQDYPQRKIYSINRRERIRSNFIGEKRLRILLLLLLFLLFLEDSVLRDCHYTGQLNNGRLPARLRTRDALNVIISPLICSRNVIGFFFQRCRGQPPGIPCAFCPVSSSFSPLRSNYTFRRTREHDVTDVERNGLRCHVIVTTVPMASNGEKCKASVPLHLLMALVDRENGFVKIDNCIVDWINILAS